MNEQEIKGYLDFAIEVTHEAGEIAMRYFRQKLAVANKQGKRAFDPVTRADRETETHIRDRISAAWPDHRIVGEEHGVQSGSAPWSWLIDPIDGTRGYISGSPMWGMLLGLMHNDQCVAGVMHQPYLRETWCGSAAGAYRLHAGARERLGTRATTDLDQAIMCCTHPDMFRTQTQKDAFSRVSRACLFSRFGTECLGYGMLAGGFVDLVVEGDLEAYDIAALIPIVEAAGGIITDWNGGPASGGGTVIAAATRDLHRKTLKLLAESER